MKSKTDMKWKKGLKMVYIYLAEGFEEIEALTITDILRRGGVDVRTVSIMDDYCVRGAHGIPVIADMLFEEADYAACEMIVLPGGMPGAQYLHDHEELCAQIKQAAAEGKWVCAICAAPMVLGKCGVLEGKKATIYPGMEDRLTGAQPVSAPAVKDGKVITGMAPGAAMEFALTLLEDLKGEAVAAEVREGACPVCSA